MSNKVETIAKSNNGRRSFIKKGAAGTALITTISSKSAWAASCSCSGNLSNNASAQEWRDENCIDYTGYSQGSWRGHRQGQNPPSTWNQGNKAVVFSAWKIGGMTSLDSLTVKELLSAENTYLSENIYTGFPDTDPLMLVQDALWDGGTFNAEWQQIITGVLNATLWAILLKYPGNCDQVSADFYYPLSKAGVLSADSQGYLSGYHSL
ncbi:hypothetical protein [Catenovulum agarivorans]|uniref:hypothetical protein n=1 Tax=Catenovulum agarivorans TaxID=1172192 RepID=UPI0003073566|nr:hypothetical protein [Catenovulum agarivorans]